MHRRDGIPLKVFPADWKKYGKSPGTRHMIDTMTKAAKPVYFHIV